MSLLYAGDVTIAPSWKVMCSLHVDRDALNFAVYVPRVYDCDVRSSVVLLVQVKEKAASMMFIELMFWKPAPVAQLVKEQYNWRVQS